MVVQYEMIKCPNCDLWYAKCLKQCPESSQHTLPEQKVAQNNSTSENKDSANQSSQ